MFFFEFKLAIFIPKVQIIHENAITFFSFLKLHILLHHPHLSQVFTILSLPSIHQPPWTTILKLLMHLKIDLHSFFLNFYELKTISLSLSLLIHPKKSKILFLNFLWFIEPLKLTILGGSLLFEILGAWRRLMCAKQVISLVETMKLVFFPRFVCPHGCRRLTWKHSGQCRGYFCSWLLNVFFIDDLHGSRPSLFVKKKFETASM